MTMFYKIIAACLCITQALAINPITIKGNAFFDSTTGDRFYLRGVDYQPGGSSLNNADPLADDEACQRDVPYMKQLGINTIRVYSVDNSANHTVCMNLLYNAGIYLILDVNTPHYSLNRANPQSSYNAVYLQHVFATIDAFKGYDNVLAYLAGNEIVTASTQSAPWIKAIVRDMKLYIASQSKRQIPVGYSAADISSNRVLLAEYLNCGTDANARVDYYAFNQYEWCGNQTFETSGYSNLVEDFSNYSIPLFFSEFGCNKYRPRPFTEIGTIYSTQMSPVFSGGLVYEWSQEVSDYGLVEINGSSLTLLQDFYNLKKQYANNPNPSGNGGFNANGEPSACPPNSTDFTVAGFIPSTPPQALEYIRGGAGTPTGNNGSSQDLGGNATSTVQPGTNVPNSATPSESSSASSKRGDFGNTLHFVVGIAGTTLMVVAGMFVTL